jgi:hypothetical protein
VVRKSEPQSSQSNREDTERELPEVPPVVGEDVVGAGSQDGEDDGGQGEEEEAADLAAAFEVCRGDHADARQFYGMAAGVSRRLKPFWFASFRAGTCPGLSQK